MCFKTTKSICQEIVINSVKMTNFGHYPLTRFGSEMGMFVDNVAQSAFYRIFRGRKSEGLT